MNHISYPLTIVQINNFEEPQNIFPNQNPRPQTIEPAPHIRNYRVPPGRSKVMKRCKAEYLLIKMILLKSLICKGCTFYLRLFRLAEEMFTMHTLHAFGWIFFYHLEGCDSINFIEKNPLLYNVLLLGMRIMH